MDEPTRSPEHVATHVKRRSRWWTSRWVEAPGHTERLPRPPVTPLTWTCSRCFRTQESPVYEAAWFAPFRGRATPLCDACVGLPLPRIDALESTTPVLVGLSLILVVASVLSTSFPDTWPATVVGLGVLGSIALRWLRRRSFRSP